MLSADHFDYILDVLNSGANNDDKARNAGNNCGEEERLVDILKIYPLLLSVRWWPVLTWLFLRCFVSFILCMIYALKYV